VFSLVLEPFKEGAKVKNSGKRRMPHNVVRGERDGFFISWNPGNLTLD